MSDNIIHLRQTNDNHWPMEWVNPIDPEDVVLSHGFVHPIGHWVTMGGPLAGNEAQKVDLLVHPESTQAHLVMTVVNIKTMGVKHYVPRGDYEKISQLMERGRLAEGREDEPTDASADQASRGEADSSDASVGIAQEAAGY